MPWAGTPWDTPGKGCFAPLGVAPALQRLGVATVTSLVQLGQVAQAPRLVGLAEPPKLLPSPCSCEADL